MNDSCILTKDKPPKEQLKKLTNLISRQEIAKFAQAIGITWKPADNPNINWMRCSMALQSYLESHNISDSTNTSNDTQKTQQDKVVSETMDIPSNATVRQKNLIGMINSITKKEDFDLFGSVGMIAEDDTAREFMEKMLKPRYDSWKNGHQPSVGTRAYGYIIDFADDFGKVITGDTGAFLKGLNIRVTQDSLGSLYNNLSLASMLYPRDMVKYNKLAGKSSEDYVSAKASQNTSLNFDRLLSNLNIAFSVRDTKDQNEFTYDGYDTKIYQKFSTKSRGFVRSLEHIKKNNPELATECDRMSSVYSDMLKAVDNNDKILGFILGNSRFSGAKATIESNKQIMQTELFLADVCKEHNLTPKEAYNTVYYSVGYGHKSELNVYDESGHQKTDASGNLMKINLSDYLSKHQSEYPNLDPNNIHFSSWGTGSTVRKLMQNEVPESHIMTSTLDSLVTEKSYCEVQRKVLELYNISLKPGAATSFDTSSNDPQYWDDYKALYERDVKDNPESDAVFANLQFISASVSTCSMAQRKNGHYTRPSKANDNGNALSKNFNYYYRNDWNRHDMHIQEKDLSIDEVNSTVQSQLNNIPTLSKKWLEDSRKYAEKHGNENFKGNYYDDDAKTDSQKKCRKALSVDFGSQSAVAGYMGTPVGDLITKQMTYMAKFCPQMETARFNTPEKIQKQVEDKLGYKPFVMDAPQTSSASTSLPELRKLREELYSKVHCSLKSCDSATYDNIQTKIKQDWDMGKRSSSGNRLYGHISAVFKGAYKVNNSLQEEKMLENAKKLGETPQDFFHGTNHSGATGIIGVDGRFRAPKSSADASKQGLKYAGGMLGSGVYLAKMAGKSAGYFGTWGQSYEPEGCMLMCKAVLGNTYVSSGFNSSAPASYDTVSMQAGTNTGRTILRADEWCVRNPDFVYPEYIVDMGTKRRV